MPLILAMLLNPLNDVTTSFDQPPSLAQPYDIANQTTQLKLHPEIKPKEFLDKPEDVFVRVQALVAKMGWSVIRVEGLHLEAVATTSLLKFKDDLAVDVRPTSKGSVVHMRSRSRVGKSDLGANAKRIQEFLKQL